MAAKAASSGLGASTTASSTGNKPARSQLPSKSIAARISGANSTCLMAAAASAGCPFSVDSACNRVVSRRAANRWARLPVSVSGRGNRTGVLLFIDCVVRRTTAEIAVQISSKPLPQECGRLGLVMAGEICQPRHSFEHGLGVEARRGCKHRHILSASTCKVDEGFLFNRDEGCQSLPSLRDPVGSSMKCNIANTIAVALPLAGLT